MNRTATHGSLALYRQGCKCESCSEANRQYHRDYRERKRDGMRPTSYVTVDVVAEHVDKLVAAGMTLRAIASLADVSQGTVQRIHKRSIERLWPRSADRILGITLDDLPEDGLMPAWKTQRLLLELKRAGVKSIEVARALRKETDTGIELLMGPKRVRKHTADQVRVLYALAAREGLVPGAVLKELYGEAF